ncbi:MAG: asparaginase [Rhodospirillales bacterium]|nr:asparaginase [Rhodospirillales bacterium]
MIDKNPLIVEVTRGGMVESRHRVHALVCDARGSVVHGWGDLDMSIYPRSAIKPLQALPFIETGAADAVSASTQELAFACASHNGETHHAQLANTWLARLGLTHEDLECVGHYSHEETSLYAQLRDHQVITNAHNNCSGKHCGFLSTAHHCAEPLQNYIAPEHPVQQRLIQVLGEMGDCDLSNSPTGIDGCGIPVIAMPLSALALASARMAAPDGLTIARAQASRRLTAAMAAHPYNVAGQNRFDTHLMTVGKGRFVTKTGAEGVHVGIFLKSGYGIAVKCEDGTKRATDVATANILDLLGGLDEAAQVTVVAHLATPVKNAAGLVAGEIRLADGWRG